MEPSGHNRWQQWQVRRRRPSWFRFGMDSNRRPPGSLPGRLPDGPTPDVESNRTRSSAPRIRRLCRADVSVMVPPIGVDSAVPRRVASRAGESSRAHQGSCRSALYRPSPSTDEPSRSSDQRRRCRRPFTCCRSHRISFRGICDARWRRAIPRHAKPPASCCRRGDSELGGYWTSRSAASRRTASIPSPAASTVAVSRLPPARRPAANPHARTCTSAAASASLAPVSRDHAPAQASVSRIDGRAAASTSGHSRRAMTSTSRGLNPAPRRIRSPTASDHTCAAQKTSIDPSNDAVIARAPAPDPYATPITDAARNDP